MGAIALGVVPGERRGLRDLALDLDENRGVLVLYKRREQQLIGTGKCDDCKVAVRGKDGSAVFRYAEHLQFRSDSFRFVSSVAFRNNRVDMEVG